MDEKNFVIDGFVFSSNKQYTDARKEDDVVNYIKENMNLTNSDTVEKLYHKLLDKDTFHTIIGYVFLQDLREKVVEANLNSGKNIREIPIHFHGTIQSAEFKKKNEDLEAKKYKELYQKVINHNKTLKIVIAFLIGILCCIFIITYNMDYSIFTDYREKIIDEYEDWQIKLDKKETELKEREETLLEKEENVDK